MSKYPLELQENEKILWEFRGSYSWIFFILSIILAKIPLCFFVFLVIGLALYFNKIIITNEKIFIKNLFWKEIVKISEISKITHQNHLIVIFFGEKKETFLYKNPEEFIKIFQENFSKISIQKTKDYKIFFGKISESKEKINKNIIQPAKKVKKEIENTKKQTENFYKNITDFWPFAHIKIKHNEHIYPKKISDPSEPFCPNCGEFIETIPSRKSKCKFCKKQIYILALPYRLEKTLVWENDIEEYKQHTEDFYKFQQYLRELERHGGEKIHYAAKIKYENGEKFNDILWDLYNTIVSHIASKKPRDWHEYEMILFKKAQFEFENNTGNFLETLKSSHNARLNQFRFENEDLIKSGRKINTLVIWRNSDKKEIPLEQELKNPRLPHKNQECGDRFCKCVYGMDFQ